MLSKLTKALEDMTLLYTDAVVKIDVNGLNYYIASIDGFMGEKRPGECRDPNKVIIKAKRGIV